MTEHAGAVEERFVADEQKVLGLRLRDQHSIERVAVHHPQLPGSLGMLERDGQRPKALPQGIIVNAARPRRVPGRLITALGSSLDLGRGNGQGRLRRWLGTCFRP